jgi:hypothetical protein
MKFITDMGESPVLTETRILTIMALVPRETARTLFAKHAPEGVQCPV